MKRDAFSLVELMIVIVIIGVVYTLAVTQLKTTDKINEKNLSFINLKSYLLNFSKDGKSVELLCKDDCSECTLYSGGKKLRKIKGFFDANIKIYRYDFFLGLVSQKYQDCFDFVVDADGVSDQNIIVYKEKVYDFSSYFQPLTYDSVDALLKAKAKMIQEVQ